MQSAMPAGLPLRNPIQAPAISQDSTVLLERLSAAKENLLARVATAQAARRSALFQHLALATPPAHLRLAVQVHKEADH